jgi:hypothetical protein
MPNSLITTALTLTIQDQLTLSGAIGATLVSRAVSSQFPSSQLATFSGYQTLVSTAPVALTPTGTNLYVVYLRLASGSAMLVKYQPSGGPVASANLSLGNILLYATSGLDPQISNNFWQNVTVACANSSTTSVFEYAVAY